MDCFSICSSHFIDVVIVSVLFCLIFVDGKGKWWGGGEGEGES